MIAVFMLFTMTCNPQWTDCKPGNGGYYVTKAACERAKLTLPGDVTDAMCMRKRADPD